MREDGRITKAAQPTPAPSPFATATRPLRHEATPARTKPTPTSPMTVERQVPTPPPAVPPSTTAASKPTIGSAAPLGTATSPPLEAPGSLVLKVKPWAEVTIDGRGFGRAVPPKIYLSPGPHTVILSHPDFEPFKRLVTIRSGEASALTVDLKDEAVRRKQ